MRGGNGGWPGMRGGGGPDGPGMRGGPGMMPGREGRLPQPKPDIERKPEAQARDKTPDVANPNADPAMARYAEELFETTHGGPSDMLGEVRQLVVMLLSTGECTIDRVAQHLGVDRRTVHRHLAREGQTFSGVVDAVRREFVTRYLKDSRRTLADVSGLLGFAAPSIA